MDEGNPLRPHAVIITARVTHDQHPERSATCKNLEYNLRCMATTLSYFAVMRTMKVLAVLVAVAGMALAPSSAIAAGHSSGAPKRTVAQGWLGVDLDPWEDDLSAVNVYGNSPNQLDRAAAAGVESIRFPLYWFRVQPYDSFISCTRDLTPAIDCNELSSEGPGPSDAPYYWDQLDAFVGAAAARGIKLLPSVLGAPLWASSSNYPPQSSTEPDSKLQVPIPADNSQFGAFVAKLASRYGARGTFWAGKPAAAKVAITNWQIWNEPDFEWYWPQHDNECVAVSAMATANSARTPTPASCPSVTIKDVNNKSLVVKLGSLTKSARAHLEKYPDLWDQIGKALSAKSLTQLYWGPSFLQLIKATRSAVKTADPSAKIVMPSLTNLGWVDLEHIYQAGAKGFIDAISANIFVSTANTIRAISAYRATVKKYGNTNIPMYVGEFSWSSGLGKLPGDHKMATIITNASGQAANLGATLDSLKKSAAGGKVVGAFWYRWASPDLSRTDVWDWSGLNKVSGSRVTPKPALATFTARAMLFEGCKTKLVATACKTK